MISTPLCALLGIERERHKREHDEQTIGGLRTFEKSKGVAK